MPDYVYHVLYLQGEDRRVRSHLDRPVAFAGTPGEFARAMLLAWLAGHPHQVDDLVIVNVWDADRDGRGVPANIIARVTTWDLDEGPFATNQLRIGYGWYHVLSPDYMLVDDAVIGMDGEDIVHGTRYGLVVPGEGPALKIRSGRQHAWITLDVAVLDREPEPDLAAWEAVEQAVIEPSGQVRVADEDGQVQRQLPDLTGGRRDSQLAIRVSARGRDRPPGSVGHPRRSPVEEHLVQAWPVPGPAPHRVLKRDRMTRDWERQ